MHSRTFRIGTAAPGRARPALGHLALGLAAGALASGYGRAAYAGTCSPLAFGSYICSGAADPLTDVTQSFGPVAGDLEIDSRFDFGLDTTVSGGRGIEALGDEASGSRDIEITATDVSAEAEAIFADTTDTLPSAYNDFPEIEIDTFGGAVASQSSAAIRAAGDYAEIDIRASDVSGATGIITETYSYGSGARIDTRSGTVTGTSDAGIYAYGGVIEIDTADVTGASDGIVATPEIYTDLRIDTTDGTVTGVRDTGISAGILQRPGYPASADLLIRTADVAGGTTGILANSGDFGTLEITTIAGSVEGGTGEGIDADGSIGSDVDITTADVTGGEDGIDAFGGSVQIDTTAGSVTGRTGDGIYAGGGFYGPVEIATGDVSGFQDGIDAYSVSEGIRIDTTGGSVTATTGDGISADASYLGDVSISVARVSAGGTGIELRSGRYEADDVGGSIEILGAVTGDVGIDTSGFRSDVRIDSAGRIEGRGGIALDLGDGAQEVTIFDGLMGLRSVERQGIVGRSFFGGGDDTLSFVDTTAGGNILYDGIFSGLFDGGSGTDQANFSVGFGDLQFTTGGGSSLGLFFEDPLEGSARLSFTNFELFTFADNPGLAFTPGELRGMMAVIPVPPGVLLLGSALGLLGFRRRRAS